MHILQKTALRRSLQALLLAALAVGGARPAVADRLADVRQRGVLLWGADQEGGGPYVYPRQDDPNQVTGFEVELAGRLADYLKLRAEFTQGQWDSMPDMLRTGKVDMILNGYELTPERLEFMDATIPYYVYRLQLLGRRGDPIYRDWESLKAGPGRAAARIGVLTGSAAEAYMRRYCSGCRRKASCAKSSATTATPIRCAR